MSKNPDWWRGALLYEVYIRSFADSNDDGVGDLAGLTARLDYIADLGIDAVWITPFFTSPMKDYGYDIADYKNIEPVFGNLADFDAMVEKAHGLGLKIIIDQVWSHTSDQHEWFLESASSRDNPKHDWYVWADVHPDGSVPNNWLSVFGGSAWQWSDARQQCYLHNFLKEQPDLNWHNPQVQEAIWDAARFWMSRGVDGFRVDAPVFMFHDQQLRDNPPRPKGGRQPDGFPPPEINPFSSQLFEFNILQPQAVEVLTSMRAVVDEVPGTCLLGEVNAGDDSILTAGDYTRGNNRMHFAYTGALFEDERPDAEGLRRIIRRVQAAFEHSDNICWSASNHDMVRVASRWKPSDASLQEAFDRWYAALLLTLGGAVCLYQGEELGLPEADVPYEALQDPYGITMWPEFKGRDGCRTPMPWQQGKANAGFSTARPWLPVDERHLPLAVDAQTQQRESMLHHYKRLIVWRRANAVLSRGEMRLLQPHPYETVGWVRTLEGQPYAAVCLFNGGGVPSGMHLPEGATIIETFAGSTAAFDGEHLRLPPFGYCLMLVPAEQAALWR